MPTKKPTPPKWIIIRLGDDLNWWLDEASSDIYSEEGACSLFDQCQIAYLRETLEEYRHHGYDHRLFNPAFQLLRIESELDDNQFRLAPVEQDSCESGEQLFALPLIDHDETGPYYELLDAITAAHIHKLNATYHYARECTDWEMQDELGALDRHRYFASENIHCFDEINEILQWRPAAWDDSSSA